IPAAVAVVRLQHARACGKMFGETSAKAFSVHVSIDIAAPFHGARCVEHFLDADFGDHVRMSADDNAAPIGRAPVCTPVTNAHNVCRLLLDKKKKCKYRT